MSTDQESTNTNCSPQSQLVLESPPSHLSSFDGSTEKHDEWYSPHDLLGCVHTFYGGCPDLDPASCETANKRVQANRFYNHEEDGLNQPWFGKVYVNPPYRRRKGYPATIGLWIRKLIHEVNSGHVEEAIFLTRANTDTQWTQRLLHAANATCFVSGRLAFADGRTGRGEVKTIRQSIVCYFGDRIDRFVDVFGELGTVQLSA